MISKKCRADEVVDFIKKDTSIMAFYNFVTLNGTNFDYDINDNKEGLLGFGLSALHAACSVGNFALAHALISAGAYINCQTWDGSTPLYYAIYNGHLNIVKLLVNNGADLIRLDAYHDTEGEYDEHKDSYIYLAEQHKYIQIAEFLQEIVANNLENGIETPKRILKGAIISGESLQTLTYINAYIRNNDTKNLKLLFDCNRFIIDVGNLIFVAINFTSNCSLELIKLLVERGSCLTARSININEVGKCADLATKLEKPNIADYLNSLQQLRYKKLLQAGHFQENSPLFLFGMFSDSNSTLYQGLGEAGNDLANQVVTQGIRG